MALPANASPINTSDTISDTIKTTAGYFTDGDGTLSGENIHTQSIGASNDKYYYNVTQITGSQEDVQFSVTFGHFAGTGSDTIGDSNNNKNTLRGETQAIYKQLASLLLEETEVSGGFKIASNGSSDHLGSAITTGMRDDSVYAIIGKRSKFKDRMNKKAWTLVLSGSRDLSDDSLYGQGVKLHLTDDSKDVAAVATPGGPRYNIVSGALGVAETPASSKTYGFFYPEMGIMLFSGYMMSSSLPGSGSWLTSTAADTVFQANPGDEDYSGEPSGSGLAVNDISNKNDNNALKFVNCMRRMSSATTFRLRSEEDQTQENYFCRIKATEYNFSANPTFVSGSKNKLRNTDMFGNPQTFITGVGLYNSAGQLLAIAKLSSPLKKNFASEATIKVKLTY